MDVTHSLPKRQKIRDSSPDLPADSESDPYSPPDETLSLPPQQDSSPIPRYETIPTQPLQRNQPKTQLADTDRHTQATQIISRNISPPASPSFTPVVQVAASSPPTAPLMKSGFLANSVAPAGTAFRVPYGVRKAPPQPSRTVVEISSDDEGPTYRGGSSDSDASQLRKSDIKTATFVRRGQDAAEEKVEESPNAKAGPSKFQEITASSFYRPTNNDRPKVSNLSGTVFDPRNRDPTSASSSLVTGRSAIKRSSDTLASAYGGVSRIPKKPRQNGPSRALPVLSVTQPDMSFDEIEDYQVRQKVKKMRLVLTNQTVRACYGALLAKKGHFDDAIDYLSAVSDTAMTFSGNHVDLTGSEDELMMTPAAPKATQQARAPVRKIQDKWGQQFPKKPLPQQPALAGPVETVRKGGRLVRGPKNRKESSPLEEPPHQSRKTAPQVDSSDSDEPDSGHHSSSDDGTFEGRLLAFFNSCTPADLADIAGISLETATYIVAKKPFKSLNTVRQIPPENVKPNQGKRKPQPIGDRIVDKCDEMITSYEAVDTLVRKCETIGKPLAKEMKGWGIDIFGAREGELDMVSLKNSQPSNHDSGIGTPISEQGEEVSESSKKSLKNGFISQPSIMGDDVQMKDYQVVGINWLVLLFKQKLSCILADDMGLGKTCQVIAFIAHLLETGEKGPHLVVVPSSTLENWLAEFRKFCPTLQVEPLYGSQSERFILRDKIDQNRDEINVVITTYATARSKEDFVWLREFRFCCTIFDEGHYLKNGESQLYTKLVRIRSRFRLLLTGTPLQNNLRELISLLGFLLPDMFREKRDELKAIFTHKVKAIDDNHQALLSAQRIARARSMLTPFILRRKKYQVLKDLPRKIRRVEYCEMTDVQQEIYKAHQERARHIMRRRAAGEKVGNESANVLIRLRQAAIHPFMFRRIYSDDTLRIISKACVKDPQWERSNPDLIFEELVAYSDMEVHQLCSKSSALKKHALKNDEWMISGKVEKLCELLLQFKEEGYRTLIFSQFVMVMDILELVLQTINMQCFRLDGNTKVEERQDMINEFNMDENAPPIFMLSTKAGGAGINLARANKVIIFDSGFNPQDDIQAENRAHRIGQEKEVEVIRLLSKATVEEQIHAMGLTKLALDDKVAGEAEEKSGSEKREAEGMKMVEEMFFEKLKAETDGPDSTLEDGGSGTTAKGDVKLPERTKKEAKDAKVKTEAV